MTKHPGDPRSDVFGEQQFDPNEYPGGYFTPPTDPPKVPNRDGYIPWRGQEQHGVDFQEAPQTHMPFAGADNAHRAYIDDVTPRDISTIDPVKVEIVANPSLIEPRHIKFSSYNFPVVSATTPSWMSIVQAERFRKRCVIYAAGSAGGAATLRIASSPDASTFNSLYRVIPTNSDVLVLDAEVQEGLWVWIISATDPTVVISVQVEYYTYDGNSLGIAGGNRK